MAQMEYQTDDLRTGSKHSHHASQSASNASKALDDVGGDSPFGDVSGATSLHGAVGHAKTHHQTMANHVAHNASMQGQRASNTADLGDDNTDETTALAPRMAQSSQVSQGM